MPDTENMPEETTEQTARRVIKRWERGVKWFLFVTGVIIFAVVTPLMNLLLDGLFPIEITYTTLSFLLIMTLLFLGFLQGQRQYARSLGELQKDALRDILQNGTEQDAKIAETILKASGETVPEKEYVRASSVPEQSETLLRAAQPTTDNAQEQLLRPMQE